MATVAAIARNHTWPASVPSPSECATPSPQATVDSRWRLRQRARRHSPRVKRDRARQASNPPRSRPPSNRCDSCSRTEPRRRRGSDGGSDRRQARCRGPRCSRGRQYQRFVKSTHLGSTAAELDPDRHHEPERDGQAGQHERSSPRRAARDPEDVRCRVDHAGAACLSRSAAATTLERAVVEHHDTTVRESRWRSVRSTEQRRLGAHLGLERGRGQRGHLKDPGVGRQAGQGSKGGEPARRRPAASWCG